MNKSAFVFFCKYNIGLQNEKNIIALNIICKECLYHHKDNPDCDLKKHLSQYK